MAQWWSTSLPRRGSRVRSPSRALEKSSDTEWYRCFFFESNPGLEGSVEQRSTGPLLSAAKARQAKNVLAQFYMKVVFTLIITLIRGLAVSPHYINKNRTRRILTSFFMKYDSSFSYDYFTSKIISILESIIYTDDRNNLTMCQNRI